MDNMAVMRLFGWMRGKWPTVDIYSPRGGGRGDIKTMSVQDLERLQGTAAANPNWSATGRPAWLREHKDRISQVMLVVFAIEHPSVYRCLVTAILDDGSGGQFTLEVAFADFNSLPDISAKTLVTLAHRYLLNFPHLDLDPEQKAAWKRLMEQ